MNETPAPVDWEAEVVSLLDELSAVQNDLLDTILKKQRLLVKGDLPALDEIEPREEELGQRLQNCHRQRLELLERAQMHGLPSDSIAQLTTALPSINRSQVDEQLQQAGERTRFLQHHGLTNWVLAQRSLLHLSQLLEILATGGQLQPTYSKEDARTEETAHSRGALVDHAA